MQSIARPTLPSFGHVFHLYIFFPLLVVALWHIASIIVLFNTERIFQIRLAFLLISAFNKTYSSTLEY